MPRRKAKRVVRRVAKDGNDRLIVYVVLAIIVLFLIFFSIYVFNSLKNITSTIPTGTNTPGVDFSSKEALITANIASCGSDINCVNLFRDRNYQCASGLSPTCISKFCECR